MKQSLVAPPRYLITPIKLSLKNLIYTYCKFCTKNAQNDTHDHVFTSRIGNANIAEVEIKKHRLVYFRESKLVLEEYFERIN